MFNKFFYVVVLMVVLMVGLVFALPVTYNGDLIINNLPGQDVNVTINSSYGVFSGLFNDSYQLQVVGDEGENITLFVNDELYSSFVQAPLASVITTNIFWPKQPDGGSCTVDEQCLFVNCCTSSSASNYGFCGVCVYPINPASESTAGSNGGNTIAITSNVPLVEDEVEVIDEVDDLELFDEDLILVNDSLEVIVDQEIVRDSWFVVFFNKLKSWAFNFYSWSHFYNVLFISFSLLLLFLYLFRYRREDD